MLREDGVNGQCSKDFVKCNQRDLLLIGIKLWQNLLRRRSSLMSPNITNQQFARNLCVMFEI